MAVRKIFIAEISRTMMYVADCTHTVERDRASKHARVRGQPSTCVQVGAGRWKRVCAKSLRPHALGETATLVSPTPQPSERTPCRIGEISILRFDRSFRSRTALAASLATERIIKVKTMQLITQQIFIFFCY